jgi:hypothetical protein
MAPQNRFEPGFSGILKELAAHRGTNVHIAATRAVVACPVLQGMAFLWAGDF